MLDSTFGRSELRLSNIHVPGAGAACSTSRCTLGQGLAHLRADAGANPDVYEFLEAEQIGLPAQAPGRASSERGGSVPCQFPLSSGKLDQAAPGAKVSSGIPTSFIRTLGSSSLIITRRAWPSGWSPLLSWPSRSPII